MTRIEQIEKESKKYLSLSNEEFVTTGSEESKIFSSGFEAGAKWADNHPDFKRMSDGGIFGNIIQDNTNKLHLIIKILSDALDEMGNREPKEKAHFQCDCCSDREDLMRKTFKEIEAIP